MPRSPCPPSGGSAMSCWPWLHAGWWMRPVSARAPASHRREQLAQQPAASLHHPTSAQHRTGRRSVVTTGMPVTGSRPVTESRSPQPVAARSCALVPGACFHRSRRWRPLRGGRRSSGLCRLVAAAQRPPLAPRCPNRRHADGGMLRPSSAAASERLRSGALSASPSPSPRAPLTRAAPS